MIKANGFSLVKSLQPYFKTYIRPCSQATALILVSINFASLYASLRESPYGFENRLIKVLALRTSKWHCTIKKLWNDFRRQWTTRNTWVDVKKSNSTAPVFAMHVEDGSNSSWRYWHWVRLNNIFSANENQASSACTFCTRHIAITLLLVKY